MAGQVYIVLYQYSGDTKSPRLWTRSIIYCGAKVWIPHLDITGEITTFYLRSYGHWAIKITTSDGQISSYIDVARRAIPGKDMQPRQIDHVSPS